MDRIKKNRRIEVKINHGDNLMSKRLDRIKRLPTKDEREIPLREYLKELSGDLSGTYDYNGRHLENIVIRRIEEIEEKRSSRVRNNILLVTSIIGAIVAVFWLIYNMFIK